jgi:hypothetical protein
MIDEDLDQILGRMALDQGTHPIDRLGRHSLHRELTIMGVVRELTGKRQDRTFGYTKYLELCPGAQSRE